MHGPGLDSDHGRSGSEVGVADSGAKRPVHMERPWDVGAKFVCAWSGVIGHDRSHLSPIRNANRTLCGTLRRLYEVAPSICCACPAGDSTKMD